MEGRCGPRRSRALARHSISLWGEKKVMSGRQIRVWREWVGQEEADIVLVQDNPDDLELVLRALRRGRLANHVEAFRGGDQALNSLLYRGVHSRRRSVVQPPRLDPVDPMLSKRDGLQVLKQRKSNSANKPIW